MKLVQLINKGIKFLQDQDIELRIRMLFFLEYAALFATVFGTIVMLALATSVSVLIPNIILTVFLLIGLYLTHVNKKYDLATILIVGGCSYLTLPYMFFTAGGNKSGMPMWFLFGIAFTCMMTKGKLRIIMSFIGLLISGSCMLIGELKPDWVMPLENETAEFTDMFQSYLLVAIVLCLSLMMYLSAYDRKERMLEQKGRELQKAINTDPLTGIENRHAFYEDSEAYHSGLYRENLVFVTLDINGLKKTNDMFGHDAGDELIKSSSEILKRAFSKYGKIYRTGGDEFVAILFCSDIEANNLGELLTETINKYNTENNSSVAMAIGVSLWNENKNMNFFELGKLADSNMYKDKNEYYKTTGLDRRKR